MSTMYENEPVKIELVTAVKGLDFDETHVQSQVYTEDSIAFGFFISTALSLPKADGRFKDLEDIKQLQRERENEFFTFSDLYHKPEI